MNTPGRSCRRNWTKCSASRPQARTTIRNPTRPRSTKKNLSRTSEAEIEREMDEDEDEEEHDDTQPLRAVR